VFGKNAENRRHIGFDAREALRGHAVRFGEPPEE
jgi:hypothetical protein